jgi:hypothetical protein
MVLKIGGTTISTITSTALGMAANKEIRLGDGNDRAHFEVDSTNDSLMIGVPSEAAGEAKRNIIVADFEDIIANYDFSHAASSNPTVFIHSANQSTTEWISLTHNQTDGVITTGAGNLNLVPAGGTVAVTGTLTAATLNTGQGANELYDMNQNVLTTSDVVFNNIEVTGTLWNLGAELAGIGEWTAPGDWSADYSPSDPIEWEDSSQTGFREYAHQTVAITSGRTYRVTFDADIVTTEGSDCVVYLSNEGGAPSNAVTNGANSFDMTAGATDTLLSFGALSGQGANADVDYFYISNISVKLVELTVTGGNITGYDLDIDVGTGTYKALDNAKITLGTTPEDLRLYSDGTNGIITTTTALRIGDATTNYTNISSTGDMSFVGSAGFYPRFLTQADEPAAGTTATQCDTGEMVVWKDSDDSKVYLCFNDSGTVKTVEMA